MAYTTITALPNDLDDEITTFAGTVTSIDGFHGLASHGQQVVALIEYTA